MGYSVYTCLPGCSHQLDAAELTDLFIEMRQQKLVESVFYDGQVTSADHFVEMMQSDEQWFYVICGSANRAVGNALLVRGQVPLAFCWLNNKSGATAMIHFGVFRHALHEALTLGGFIVRMLLYARHEVRVPYAVCCGDVHATQAYMQSHQQRPFCLDALYGLTPLPYRHTIAFVQALGFTPVGVLPSSVRLLRRGKEGVYDGLVTTLTRASLMTTQTSADNWRTTDRESLCRNQNQPLAPCAG